MAARTPSSAGPQNGAPFEGQGALGEVVAGGADVGALRMLVLDGDLVKGKAGGLALDLVGVLEGDNGVGAGREGGAGHDADGGAGRYGDRGRLARRHVPHDPQRLGGGVVCAPDAVELDGVAVHGGVVGGGNVNAGVGILGKHLAQGLQKGTLLGLQDAEVGQNAVARLLHAQHVGVVVAVGVPVGHGLLLGCHAFSMSVGLGGRW